MFKYRGVIYEIIDKGVWETYCKYINDKYELGKIGILSARGKPIFQFDKSMNFIKEFHTAKEAATFIGCHPTLITRCANKKYKFAKGYTWSWKDSCCNQKMRYNELRKIKEQKI